MQQKPFSYSFEKSYYSRNWPVEAKPYLHLEPYLRCWLEPETVFNGKQVLDLGAGECTYTRLISHKFEPRQIVACELFYERMLPAARANRALNLKFVSGDTFHLPFRSESFDVVFGTFVLHQLPDLDEAISEISRVLRRGGLYAGIEPNPYHPIHLYRYVRGRHSLNQYLLAPKHLVSFKKAGFDLKIAYFYAKRPRIRNRLLGTCMGILAKRRS